MSPLIPSQGSPVTGGLSVADFDDRLGLPTLGWTTTPTPVTALPELADELGLGWLGMKRDDLSQPTSGGTKVRKLDVLLAAEPFTQANRWVTVGAIGSGHAVCCAQAAQLQGKSLHAHLFWEPLCPSVLANLAAIVSAGATLSYHRSRLSLALTAPTTLLPSATSVAMTSGAAARIPAGGTTATSTLGLVRGGLELASQVKSGLLPAPDVVFVAFGTGGTAAGLALGLQLGGLSTRVVAVATVEHILTPTWALSALLRRVTARLHAAGLSVDVAAARPLVLRGWLGRGYGDASPAAVAACARMAAGSSTSFDSSQSAAHPLAMEPIYTGKAMAALLALSPDFREKSVLFWGTAHGELPPPEPDWRARLPARLQRRLAAATAPTDRRRRALIGVTLGAVGLGLGGYRLLGYAPLPTWHGTVLTAVEARIVMALAEALLPRAARTGSRLQRVAEGVDAYLATMPPPLQRLSRVALLTVEQATPLQGDLRRASRLSRSQRLRAIERLHRLGGPLAEAARGARDLVLLGWYQQPASWPRIGYAGPMVVASPRPIAPVYAALIAADGQQP